MGKHDGARRRIDSRGGFTVAEVVIALTVIVLVSATSLGLILSQLRVEQKTTMSVSATNMAENAVECFRYASDTGADEENFYLTLDAALAKCGYTKKAAGQYTAEEGGATALASASVTDGKKQISVTVTNGKGEEILSLSYEK